MRNGEFVIAAGIAVKWVVEEDTTAEALALRRRAKLIAPGLLLAECANVLWRKVQRNELSKDEALLAARLLQASDIEFLPTRSLMDFATRAAIELDHPAYDCVFLPWLFSTTAGLSPPTSVSCVNLAKGTGASFTIE